MPVTKKYRIYECTISRLETMDFIAKVIFMTGKPWETDKKGDV